MVYHMTNAHVQKHLWQVGNAQWHLYDRGRASSVHLSMSASMTLLVTSEQLTPLIVNSLLLAKSMDALECSQIQTLGTSM